jgi:hypothetical protein
MHTLDEPATPRKRVEIVPKRFAEYEQAQAYFAAWEKATRERHAQQGAAAGDAGQT